MDLKERQQSNVVEVGSVVGFCPRCFIAVGSLELESDCRRCGQILFVDVLLTETRVHIAKQTIKQAINAEYFPMSKPGAYDQIKNENKPE